MTSIPQFVNEHNHEPEYNENKRRIMVEELKKLCISTIEPPKRIANEIVFRNGFESVDK